MSRERILVVDDEPQILRFLKPSLAAAVYDVITAATGTEALEIAATAAPAVIVLDLGLPDMDGKDVIKSLRAWSKIPIIVLSARDRETEKIAALDLGADDYVNKPFWRADGTVAHRSTPRGHPSWRTIGVRHGRSRGRHRRPHRDRRRSSRQTNA